MATEKNAGDIEIVRSRTRSAARMDGQKPVDPARIAAGILIERCLSERDIPVDSIAADGIVVILQTSAHEWQDVVIKEWRSFIRDGQQYIGFGRSELYDYDGFILCAPTEPPKASKAGDESEGFAKAIGAGKHILGITHDLSWLSSDLLESADYSIVLPEITATDIGLLATDLHGGEVIRSVPEHLAKLATPRTLRLARRLIQSADEYIDKLCDLLDRQEPEQSIITPAPVATKSVRKEPTLDRLHGMAEAVAWGTTVARDLELFTKGEITWADVDHGCLLSGPPGCGKTLFARALAESCDVDLVVGSYGEWIGTGTGHQGDLLRSMRKTFAAARSKDKCILFIDEIDSFPDRGSLKSDHQEWWIPVVNTLLAEIDGTESREGVVLIAACNHPNKLDPALIRSGRLDRHIRISLPVRAGLIDILREHLGGDLSTEPLSGAALLAAESTGADCEKYVRGARRRAREGKRDMMIGDLIAEIGGEDKRSEADRRIAAVHEAGHAVAIHDFSPGGLESVSIRKVLNRDQCQNACTSNWRRYIIAGDF